jgi:Methyltransferase domain/C-methyltransferase C-terminal domain
MLYQSQLAARNAMRGRLEVVACLDCGFVFNATFDSTLMSYGAGYESDQSHSPAFASHVEKLLSDLLNQKNVRDTHIIEVGCGKGAFLRSLIEAPESGNTGCGFDPSYVGPESDDDGRLRFVRSFYNEEHVSIRADVVICRHVIEHVPDPVTLLTRVGRSSPSARLFMETKDVEWILRNAVIWDFFYEYCSYFSARSMTTALLRAGFGDVTSEPIFGGQYLWVEASGSSSEVRSTPPTSDTIEHLVTGYARRESEMLSRWTETIEGLSRVGPVALWGAGAKGVTFASLFDPQAERLMCVVDVNPAKQGRFIAGSAHPIVAPSDLKTFGVRNIILLNPNYLQEIEAILQQENLDVNLVMVPGLARGIAACVAGRIDHSAKSP